MLAQLLSIWLIFPRSHSYDYFDQGEDWKDTCSSGKKQSPINFKDSEVIITDSSEGKMKVYVDLEDEFKGYFKSDYAKGTVSINRNLGSVKVNSIIYSIIGAHYHAPSEHIVNGENLDLEIHLVGQNEDGELHVIGIFFEVGEESNEFVQGTIESIESDAKSDFESTWLLIDGTQEDYYYYNGSVTAPIVNDDCVEDVKWTVLKDPISITEKQLKFFNDLWAKNDSFAGGYGNNRKVQPLNGRKVYLHSVAESWSSWILVTLGLNLLI